MKRIHQVGLLAAFVVVDAVLVVGAIRHVNGTPPESDLPSATAASAEPAPTGATPSSDSGTPAPTQVAFDFSAAEAMTMSAANDGTIVYGARGTCGSATADVQVSTDNGATFTPAQTGLTTTLAVKATSSAAISVVGTNAGCDVEQVTSTDGGRSWDRADDVTLWYPDLDDTTAVVSPRRTSQPGDGCVVSSVSQVTDAVARVSCTDGTFKGSGDEGRTWVDLGRLDNVRVSAFLTPTAGYALARFNGCAANEFTTADGGVSWTPGGCITGEPARAIAATSSSLFAVVDEDAYRSTDNGMTWSQP